MRNIENEIYRIKPVEELRFTDDFMFCRVMQTPELRLLGIKVERIEYPELQKEIRPYYSAHGVRMDVYVKDSNRIFDIEMQTSVPDDLPRRMRYYQSMIDIDTLIKGSEYETLKESYVIFLCTKDPFGLGLPVYSFSTVCKEKKDFALNDGINKLFFNASAAALEKNLEIKGFLGYLCSGKPSDTFTEDIEQRVERLKINEIFRSDYMMDALPLHDANEIFRSDYMMDALPLHDARKAGLKEGRLEGERNAKFETARNLLKKNISVEIITECTGLSTDEVLKIKKEI